MELVLSTNFLVVNGNVSFQEADTVSISLPFSQEYRLGKQPRIYFSATNLQAQPENFSMRVLIDKEEWYDRSRVLESGESFEFIYRYDQPGIR